MYAVTTREKERYDRKAHGDMFEAGDLVWLHNLQCHEVNQGNYTALLDWSIHSRQTPLRCILPNSR